MSFATIIYYNIINKEIDTLFRIKEERKMTNNLDQNTYELYKSYLELRDEVLKQQIYIEELQKRIADLEIRLANREKYLYL